MILDLPCFDSCVHFYLGYGSGKSSRKERLEYDGKKWMIKFNGHNSNLQKKRRNKIMEKYSNSVICE